MDVAFVDDHVSVTCWPAWAEAGEALRATLGDARRGPGCAAANLQAESYLEREHNARWAALSVAHATSGITANVLTLPLPRSNALLRDVYIYVDYFCEGSSNIPANSPRSRTLHRTPNRRAL